MNRSYIRCTSCNKPLLSLVELFQTVPLQVLSNTRGYCEDSPNSVNTHTILIIIVNRFLGLTLVVELDLSLLYMVKSMAGAMMPYLGLKPSPVRLTGVSYACKYRVCNSNQISIFKHF